MQYYRRCWSRKKQTYGYLLSQKLNLPISTLATPGSSISWAADQILRSDIQENDIVVWGLTSENRLTFWDEDTKSVSHLLPNIPNNHKLNTDLPKSLLEKLLVHKTNFFTSVQRIFEVVNFCKKTKAKLLMFNIHSSHLLNISLCNTKEFFYLCPRTLHLRRYRNRQPTPWSYTTQTLRRLLSTTT